MSTRKNAAGAVGAALAAALLLGACSGQSTSAVTGTEGAATPSAAASTAAPETPAASSPAPSSPEPAASAANDPALPELSPDNIVPGVDVIDVRTGGTVALGGVVPAAQPILLWAWAPHCPACRREAPKVESFAAANQDRVTVLGLGTQDDLDYARDFLADTGVKTPQMLWDPSFDSWRVLGINSQPTFILVGGGGQFLGGWVGGFPEQEVLDLAGAA